MRSSLINLYIKILINNKMKKLVRENKNEMFKFINANAEARELYEHNKRLISFRYIPKHFRKPVYNIIKKLVLELY